MKILEKTWQTTGTLHHAYFLVGDTNETVLKLISFLENTIGIKTAGNPDFWNGKFDNFTVEEARALSDSQERKEFVGKSPSPEATAYRGKIFIVQTNSITEQAQNALLKIFEEPTSGTHFFILMPQDTLLPTLHSRMQVIISKHNVDNEKKSILKKTLAERIAMVKEIADGIKEAKSSNGSIARSDEIGFREENTKQDAINILNQIETELHEMGVKKSSRELRTCQLVRESLNDNGAPVKMILENLMLSV